MMSTEMHFNDDTQAHWFKVPIISAWKWGMATDKL